MIKSITPVDWTNKDNFTYYEQVPYEIQRSYTVIGGLDVFSDLLLVKNYVDSAKSILEVGACYGRVIDFLIQNNFKGQLSAIEKSAKFFSLLQQKYAKTAKLHHADITTFSTDERFDLILWMWSGISDFAEKEQISVLKHLRTLLTPNGTLILDTFSHKLQPANAVVSANQSYVIEVENCKLYGYIPSPKEMFGYAKFIGFSSIEHLPYTTTTNRERDLYILHN